MQNIALFALVTVAMGGLAWVFLYQLLSAERKAEQRKETLVRPGAATTARTARNTQKSRREQVEGTLKELDERHSKSVPLSVKINQAGLDWSKQRFFITCGILGAVVFVAVFMVDAGLPAAIGATFAAGAGLPLWLLKFLKKRREAKFLEAFPDAVDVIVRGIKAGLPLLDSLRVIAADAPEPLRSEFRAILDTQTIGIPIGEACCKLYERIPVAEANFFGIVISIQQKAGGNLSEALGNLSRVPRDGKKLKGKIQAMSMEAKASAGIIACLPLAVMMLVYITSPQYIELLWTTPTGRMLMAGSGMWMTMGCLVMRKMINFDF